jgi:hypothetical protein
MFETDTFQALDPYISYLGGVTPSKVHERRRIFLQGGTWTIPSRLSKIQLLATNVIESPSVFLSWQRPRTIKATVGSTSWEPDDVRRIAKWLTSRSHLPKAPQFIKMRRHQQGSLGPDEDIWQTAVWLHAKLHSAWTHVSSDVIDVPGSQNLADTASGLAMYQDLRPSNVSLVSQRPDVEEQQSADEKRYKELNQKYYDGTITNQEELELAKTQHALDEADANDPKLMAFNKEIAAGLDKLHIGLHQINRILDDLLAK